MSDIHSLPVAVLCGGIGAERKVSLLSGEAVYRALSDDGRRLNVKKIELTGRPGEIADLAGEYGAGKGLVYLALHGEYGEDGTVQAELEKAGIVYTGSDAAVSALAMDKERSKRALKAGGVPVARGFMVVKDTPEAAADAVIRRLETEGIALPVVVKPNGRGSSVGVTLVKKPKELAQALVAALAEDRAALVEEYMRGTEITVSVLDGTALPIVELAPKQEFYDYQAKYLVDTTEYYCPARFDAAKTAEIQRLAVSAWRALGLRDAARIDFIVGADGMIALEANTLPGMTSHSLLPKAAGVDGLDFAGLCWRICEIAARRINR